jgi:ankyrin repeat protein
LLLKAGADANAKDDICSSPLHEASHHGEAAVAKTLISAGADVNAVDNEQVRPLHCAATAGVPELIGILLGAGAAIDAEDETGWTALQYAAASGHRGSNIQAVRMLLEVGANPNTTSNIGMHRRARGKRGGGKGVDRSRRRFLNAQPQAPNASALRRSIEQRTGAARIDRSGRGSLSAGPRRTFSHRSGYRRRMRRDAHPSQVRAEGASFVGRGGGGQTCR